MYELMRLSGQEYVDVYAPKAKEDAKRAEDEARRAAKAVATVTEADEPPASRAS